MSKKMSKRQVTLFVLAALLFVLVGVLYLVGGTTGMQLFQRGGRQIGRIVTDMLLPYIFVVVGLFTAALGTALCKVKVLQGIAYILAALFVLLGTVFGGGAAYIMVAVCLLLLGVFAFLRDKPFMGATAPVLGYVIMFALLISVISYFVFQYNYFIGRNGDVVSIRNFPLRHIVGIDADILLSLALLCVGAGIANAKPGKFKVIAARVGILGLLGAVTTMVLGWCMNGLGNALNNVQITKQLLRFLREFSIPGNVVGQTLPGILLVVMGVLLLGALILLPLCIIYPLGDKEAAAAKKAAKLRHAAKG